MASKHELDSSSAKPHSILKDTGQIDADAASFTKFVDKPRVAFANTEPDNPSEILPASEQQEQQPIKKKANLIIRPEEETRVVLALQKAAKKQATGSIFSVIVDISKNGTLDIGVKDLPENLLVVSLLKRGNSLPGAAEEAGSAYSKLDIFVSLMILCIFVCMRIFSVCVSFVRRNSTWRCYFWC
jgi:hypothetical protein